MGPLSPKHPATFRLTFATDRGVGPRIESADKEIELVPLQEYARRAKFWTVSLGDLLVPVSLLLGFLTYIVGRVTGLVTREKTK